jgi:AcrR family transcriptional regulator
MAARPAGDAEERLIEAGKEILAEEGLGGLSVRAVAARAGVNLGLVSYHFGGKDAFVQRVVGDLYEEFFADFSLGVEGETDPYLALRKGLLHLARFVRDHRAILRSLVKDAMNGDQVPRDFIRQNFPRHGQILAGLVRKCVAVGALTDLPLPVLMSTIMGVVVAPTLMADPLIKSEIKAMGPKEEIEKALLSDEGLELRVALALKAVRA